MSFVLAAAGFAALVILHELGHFMAAKAVGMRVERFALFFPPMLVKVKRGETEYGIGAIPLGGFVRITGMNPLEEIPPAVAHRAYYRQPVWKRIVVISAGPAMNLLVAFVILWALFLSHGTFSVRPVVAQVERHQPATGVLHRGDKIVAVDGVRGSPIKIVREVDRHRCAGGSRDDGCRARQPVIVVVRRHGRVLTFKLYPRYERKRDQMRLGFKYGEVQHPAGPLRSTGLAVSEMWRFTRQTVSVVGRLFESKERRKLSGVVGAYHRTQQSISFDATQALFILAVISLSLAVVNLFPFLPLDGGHIFWALAEKVRGRPIAFSVMERASVIGFALVIMLFFIGLSNDIDRLRGAGSGLR